MADQVIFRVVELEGLQCIVEARMGDLENSSDFLIVNHC
jgi:hypothetical protein